MAGVEIITFGCRLNAFESELIGRAAAAAGLQDAVIINTCAVTAEAERQARQAIRRARRERPAARIIVTGCAATLAPERYAAVTGVDFVLDNPAKLRAESYAREAPTPTLPHLRGREQPDAASSNPRTLAGEGERRVRGYVQVQQGCDHRCTFCIIPYARGSSRSLPPAAIAAEARALIDSGCREIVLTGVDLTAYGDDLSDGPSLGGMVKRLLGAVPALDRLRLSSLDPGEIDADLWDLVAGEARLMPHLHLSLQAGDDLILKRMKRRHSRAQAIAAAARARALRPDIALGADLIAGFPTESDDMFRRSLDLVEECGIAFLHVFPYSPRPGTPAARMPQLDPALVRERARRLREAGAAALAAELARRVGDASDVLVERPGRGRADCYAAVRLDNPVAPVGSVQRVRFAAAGSEQLLGVPAP
jgi:threonylcarbamoyladenosine tRNA methylthiotransferase MtaB